MKYYAAQIKTKGEDKFINLFRALNPGMSFPIYFPKREMRERRKEKLVRKSLSVFPGYVFVEIGETQRIEACHWALRRTDGFIRFLRSNQDVAPLEGRDLELVLHFIKRTGHVAGVSKVYFNEADRIVVNEGPLKGLEGNIIRVDKRKGRAKIKLDLYGEAFLVDLAFEVMDPHKEP
ncbi:MAG: antiterminator LoaP [Spirochaetaceae bacterium]|jgi:transcriptional antiterminator NusG|nr:antiterminator LoaP [Spirochaetaceae bacterium]